jgi:dephospho-CoA kinase
MTIIGITGTIGAGKGTVVEYLKTKGFKHYSARAFLVEEIRRRGMLETRENMFEIANEFRKNNGPEYMIGELVMRAAEKGNGVVESIRSLGEVEVFRKNAPGQYLLAVNARPELRYERIKLRGTTTDNVTYQEFLEDEHKENNNTEPWKQNLLACISKADFVIENNGSIDEFHEKIDKVLHKIKV